MELKSMLEHKVVSGQAREVIAKVILFVQLEAIANGPIKEYRKVQKPAALETGVSFCTIEKLDENLNLALSQGTITEKGI